MTITMPPRKAISTAKANGLRAGSFITKSLALAEYYAETIEDEGEDPIIIGIDPAKVKGIAPDMMGIAEPIMSVMREEFMHQDEESVISAWEASDGSGQTCMDLIGSAVITETVPACDINFSIMEDDVGSLPKISI